jgi:hypothetical protein
MVSCKIDAHEGEKIQENERKRIKPISEGQRFYTELIDANLIPD